MMEAPLFSRGATHFRLLADKEDEDAPTLQEFRQESEYGVVPLAYISHRTTTRLYRRYRQNLSGRKHRSETSLCQGFMAMRLVIRRPWMRYPYDLFHLSPPDAYDG
ncbi:unnamed protein product [Polarella glacialis]|uniref:Uncharacterized protein n=1 Tax=Polarella glacialis TaxID=89957 RepID=A0A813GJH1_POLGL|nr:unnamed protein product [Polarella glacialis]